MKLFDRRFVPAVLVIWLLGLAAVAAAPSARRMQTGACGVQGARVQTHRLTSPPPRQVPDRGALIRAAALQKGLRDAQWGLIVVRLDGQRVLLEREPNRLLVPASNMKLYTAAAAFRVLGGGFRWHTSVFATPAVDGAVETLTLRGSGDPTLAAAQLEHLARVVSGWGIHVIKHLVLDTSAVLCVRYGPGWAWDDETEDYSAPLGGLGVNENVVRLRIVGTPLSADASPSALTVSADPAGVLQLENHAVCGPSTSADTLSIHRQEGTNRVVVSGSIPAGRVREEAVAVRDGAEYAGLLFARDLRTLGISVRGVPTVVTAKEGHPHLAPPPGRELGCVQSPPLREVLRTMMKESDNYIAEQVLRTIPRRPGTGLGTLARALAPLGVSASRRRQVDGSGLSRMDLVTPHDTLRLLVACARQKEFLETLPVAGVDGTLSRRFRTSPLRGRLCAKTGSMTGISAISGYVLGRDGKPRWAFSFIINDSLARSRVLEHIEDRLLNRIFLPILDTRRSPPPGHPTRKGVVLRKARRQ